MLKHVLAPRRPDRVPLAGTFLSLTAHAAVVGAIVGGGGTATTPGDGATSRAGVAGGGAEQLHWVGVGDGAAADGRRPRPVGPPPLAYVIPGSGAVMERVAGSDAPRRRVVKGGGAPGERAAPESAELSPTPAPRPTVRRWVAPLPDVARLAPDATLLVAGVLSSAPDPNRQASRPEDFVRVPPAALVAGSGVRAEMTSTELARPDVHVDDLPIPLIGNPPPSYPAALEQARVGGQVVVEFRVDSTGVIDLGTLRVVQSTHVAFTQAVRNVLPRLRFLPAQLERQAVGVTVRQPFLFVVRGMR